MPSLYILLAIRLKLKHSDFSCRKAIAQASPTKKPEWKTKKAKMCHWTKEHEHLQQTENEYAVIAPKTIHLAQTLRKLHSPVLSVYDYAGRESSKHSTLVRYELNKP